MSIDEVRGEETQAEDQPDSGRRALLTKAGAAAAVAAVAGLATSQSVRAANGDTVIVGFTTTGTSNTTLSGGTTLRVENGTSNSVSSIFATQSNANRDAIHARHSSSGGAAVHGRNTGTNGVGVLGTNNETGGIGVEGTNSFDGQFGVRGTTSGSGGAGVRGRATGSSGHGVHGSAAGSSGAGVYGTHAESDGAGVYGHHTSSSQSGPGVLGVSEAGVGVVGRGSRYDVQADGGGKIGLTEAGNTGGPSQNGSVGTIARDSGGNLWYCYATNSWQRMGGPGAAGSYHAITPVRAFDSRIGAIPASGFFSPTEVRPISIKDGRDNAGAVSAADAVPAGATAITFNVTSTQTGGASFLAVVPGDEVASTVSTLNWIGSGISIANAGTVGVDGSRQVAIIAGPGGGFHAIVDITGYYI